MTLLLRIWTDSHGDCRDKLDYKTERRNSEMMKQIAELREKYKLRLRVERYMDEVKE